MSAAASAYLVNVQQQQQHSNRNNTSGRGNNSVSGGSHSEHPVPPAHKPHPAAYNNNNNNSAPGASSPATESMMMSSSANYSKRPVEQILGGYAIGETIGRGSFGKVKRGRHLATNEPVAIKILNYEKLKAAKMDKKIFREIKILRLFSHPNICRLYEVIHTPSDIYLIMEHVEGGELYDYIVQQGSVKEVEARYIFQQLVCALEYCHHFRVVHRDLKPENILLGPGLQVKLIDFGLSNIMQDGLFLATSCGSANYAAPEVISGKLYCGPEVDVWSCGVILYALMCGFLPFDEDTAPALFAKIKKGKYEIPGNMSKPTANLISHLLCVDPLKRLTIPQIRDNDWFNVKLPARLSYAASIACVGEGSHRIQSKVVSEVARRLNCRAKEVWLHLDKGMGPGYTAYHILVDAQQRRTIATEFRQLLTGGEDPYAHGSRHHSASGSISHSTPNNNHPQQPNASAFAGGEAINNSDPGYQHQHRTVTDFPGGGGDIGMNSASQSFNSLSAMAPPLPVQYAAATRELHLGMMLSQSPAMEVLLDRHNAAATKDAYNKCIFMPASVTEVGGWNNSQPQESSSMGTTTSLRGSFREPDSQRLRRASLCGGHAGARGGGGSLGSSMPNSNGKFLFGSFPMGGAGANSGIYVRREGSSSGTMEAGAAGTATVERSRDAISRRSSLHRHGDRGDGSKSNGPVVGSVASAGMAYTAKEHQFFAEHNVGWRLGIMSDRASSEVLAVVYKVLRHAEMQWKVLSPFQLLARTTEATWKVLGLEMDEAMLRQEQEDQRLRREREAKSIESLRDESANSPQLLESGHDNMGSLPEWQTSNVLPDSFASDVVRSGAAKSCGSREMRRIQPYASDMPAPRKYHSRSSGTPEDGDGAELVNMRFASSSQPPFSTEQESSHSGFYGGSRSVGAGSGSAPEAMTRLSRRTSQHPPPNPIAHRGVSRENSNSYSATTTPMKQSMSNNNTVMGNMINGGCARSFSPADGASRSPSSLAATASVTPNRRTSRSAKEHTPGNMTNISASWNQQRDGGATASSSAGGPTYSSRAETGLLTPMKDNANVSPKSATLVQPPLISTPMRPKSVDAENLIEKRTVSNNNNNNNNNNNQTNTNDFVQMSPVLFSDPSGMPSLPPKQVSAACDPMRQALPLPLTVSYEQAPRNPPEEVHVKIHIFRIHEKHDQGYIVDWSVQKNFLSGMDVVHRLSKDFIEASK